MCFFKKPIAVIIDQKYSKNGTNIFIVKNNNFLIESSLNFKVIPFI